MFAVITAAEAQCGSLLTAYWMLNFIYAQSPTSIIAAIIISGALWGYLCAHADRRKWRFTNALLLLAATLIILHTTLLSRTPGIYTAILTPFAALAARGSSRSFTGRC